MAFTTIDDPSLYFRVKTYTGNSTNNTAITWDETHANMQPDWLWLKQRTTASQEHWLADSVRGAGLFLESNSSAADADGTGGFDSFDTNGFTVDNTARTNRGEMVAWGWKAGSSVSGNTTGSGTAKAYTGSVNTTAGISITAYTGNGTAGHTIPHNLGVAPRLVLCKRRSTTGQWVMGHSSLGFNKFLELDLTGAAQTHSGRFNDTAPTSSVFTVGTTTDTNQDGTTIISYSFAEIKGYSKFGSYKGNGSTDGVFVYTGFKPAWVMFKNTASTQNWVMLDSRRPGFNVIDDILYPNSTDTEQSGDSADFLSSGFKLRTSGNDRNGSNEIIYLAFAESPQVNSNGVPTNAG
tara:strand:+ start:100 stop:1149 length:1050 start_codon:yes stop_codon:yes gene_type:complete